MSEVGGDKNKHYSNVLLHANALATWQSCSQSGGLTGRRSSIVLVVPQFNELNSTGHGEKFLFFKFADCDSIAGWAKVLQVSAIPCNFKFEIVFLLCIVCKSFPMRGCHFALAVQCGPKITTVPAKNNVFHTLAQFSNSKGKAQSTQMCAIIINTVCSTIKDIGPIYSVMSNV